MKYQIRKLSFGEVWGEAFNLYIDNFFPLSIIAALSYIPFLFIRFPTPTNPNNPDPADIIAFLIFVIASIILGSLSSAFMLEYVSKRYLGKNQTLNEYLNNVIPLVFPILGLSIITTLIVGIASFAFLIPGLYCGLGLTIAPEILIVERKGVFDSVSRSFHLTKGEKFTILGFILLMWLIGFSFQSVLTSLFTAINLSQQLVLMISQILLAPLSACIFILVYFNIRITKEGFDLEHMVEQFPDTPAQ